MRRSLPALLVLLALLLLPGGALQAENGPMPEDAGADLPAFDEDAPESWVTVELLASRDAIRPGESVRLAVALHIARGLHTYAPGTDFLPTEVVVEAPGLEVGEVRRPPSHEIEFAGQMVAAYEGVTVFRTTLSAPDDLATDAVSVSVTVDYQGCTDQVCYMPRTADASLELPVAGPDAEVAAANEAWFGPVEGDEEAAEGDEPDAAVSNKLHELIESYGLLVALLFCFAWGVLTSLTPCVYPIIPITVAYFSSKGEGSFLSRFSLALTYALGIAVTYAVLGVIFGLAGSKAGALMASPWFVGFVAFVLLFFAGSMFGWYEIALPSSWTTKLQRGAKEQGGYVGTFFLGAVLGAVAAPCVGAFAGALLTYVFIMQDLVVGGLALFVFGLGLGSLFVVLGTFSGLIDRMPRSGEWMDTLKTFFGFFFIVMAIWFARLVLGDLAGPWLVPLMVGLVCIVWGVWTGAFDRLDEASPGRIRLARAIGLILVIYGTVLVGTTWVRHGTLFSRPLEVGGGAAPRDAGSSAPTSGLDWRTDIEDVENAAGLARENGRPVLVDFRADWCLPCVRLEEEIFTDPRVQEALEAFVLVKADGTARDSPVHRIELETYGKASMPYLAIHGPDGAHLEEISERLSEEAYAESLTPERFVEILEEVPR